LIHSGNESCAIDDDNIISYLRLIQNLQNI
jgi:hypothetical protein